MLAFISFINLTIFVIATAVPAVALWIAHRYLVKDSASDEKH